MIFITFKYRGKGAPWGTGGHLKPPLWSLANIKCVAANITHGANDVLHGVAVILRDIASILSNLPDIFACPTPIFLKVF